MRILIVEDDKGISDYLSKGLRQVGYSVDSMVNAEEALSALQISSYDLTIIDLMLPEMPGEQLIEQIRSSGNSIPILILSAKREVNERVNGLQLGADDYLTKPFSFTELVARIDALLRRTKNVAMDDRLVESDLVVDRKRRQVFRGQNKIDLRPREFSLLEYLLENRGQVMPKAMILEHIWDFYFDPQTNVLDVLIHRLRKKIDDPYEKKLIHTVRGVGYVVRDDQEQSVDPL
ncbi:MAG: response regulator transcription factor [Spirochaetaceae bacterium]|nr:response regulator transcription factor [Spirochaetaceae bacterium]MCF7951493.1 response regulator transcription factor [Spirochaetaceae bacterium]